MVAIVLPVYNVAPYIIRCLKSVTAQSYVCECIIVNDCSTDNSMNLILDFIRQYEGPIRFYIINHNVNRGLSAARNSGTRAVSDKCNWIYYLDSDDELTKKGINILYELSLRFPDADMVCGNTLMLPDIKADRWRDIAHKKKLPRYIESNRMAQNFFFNVEYLRDWIPVNAWNKLIRKDFLRDNNISFCEGLIHEDELWMFDVMQHVSKIVFSKDRSYVHYNREGSITKSGQEERSCNHRLIIAKWELAHLTPEYQTMQKERIFFMLADVYERALKVNSTYYIKVQNEIIQIAQDNNTTLPKVFYWWFRLPLCVARKVGILARKVLIS